METALPIFPPPVEAYMSLTNQMRIKHLSILSPVCHLARQFNQRQVNSAKTELWHDRRVVYWHSFQNGSNIQILQRGSEQLLWKT